MQALVITTYQNQDLLEKNLILFSKYFRCYVHVDRKSELNNPVFWKKLKSMSESHDSKPIEHIPMDFIVVNGKWKRYNQIKKSRFVAR